MGQIPATELMRSVDDPRLNRALRDASAELAKASDVAAGVERWASLYDEAVDGTMRKD